MAVKTEIEFTIGPDGNVGISVKGAKGKKCTEITKEIEEALGIVTNRTYTGEYYEEETSTQTTVNVGGNGDDKK